MKSDLRVVENRRGHRGQPVRERTADETGRGGGIAPSRRPRRIRTSRPAAVAAHAAQRARRRFGTPCILLYSIPAPPPGETKNGGLSAPENRRRAPRCIQEIFQYPETNTNGTGKRRAGRLTCSHLVRRLKTNEFHP